MKRCEIAFGRFAKPRSDTSVAFEIMKKMFDFYSFSVEHLSVASLLEAVKF